MSAERIESHRASVKTLQAEIEFLKTSGYTQNAGTSKAGDHNAELITEAENLIQMYESFIAKLRATNA
jgi:hypothetical protein